MNSTRGFYKFLIFVAFVFTFLVLLPQRKFALAACSVTKEGCGSVWHGYGCNSYEEQCETRAEFRCSVSDGYCYTIYHCDCGGPGCCGGGEPAPPPDLIVQNLSYSPSSPVAGNSMSFSGEVKNQGEGRARASTTTRLRLDDGIYWDQPTGPLEPGATETETWSGVWTAVGGTHKFEICADVNNDADRESNEGNNCATQTFSVTSQVCDPGEWGGCGAPDCSDCYRRRCNSTGTAWDCVYDPGCCPVCTAPWVYYCDPSKNCYGAPACVWRYRDCPWGREYEFVQGCTGSTSCCSDGTCVPCGPKPTPPLGACNAACSSSSQCLSGYCFLYIARCRNQACPADPDCVCDISTPTPTPLPPGVPTPTPSLPPVEAQGSISSRIWETSDSVSCTGVNLEGATVELFQGANSYKPPESYVKSLSFDGTDDYIHVVTDSPLVGARVSFTLEVWVRTSSSYYGYILSRYECGANPECYADDAAYGLSIGHYKPGKLEFHVRDDTGKNSNLFPDPRIDDNQWHHIVGGVDAENNKIFIYIDGKKEEEDVLRANSGLSFDHPANTPIEFGRLYITGWGSPTYYFGGSIDEAAYFKDARTETEIKEDFEKRGLRGNEDNLVALWRFNEGSGNTASDSMGNLPAGQVSGATWFPQKKISGTTGVNFENLRPDNYSLRASKEGYEGACNQTDYTPEIYEYGGIIYAVDGNIWVNSNQTTTGHNLGLSEAVADPWFQTQGGDVHGQTGIRSKIPTTATNTNFCMDLDNYPGVVSYTGSADFSPGGTASSKGWLADSGFVPFGQSIYDYFYQKLDSPDTETFTDSDGRKYCEDRSCPTPPAGTTVYYAKARDVNITGNNDWAIPSGAKVIVLVDGNLNISLNQGRRITVPVGSFLAFIIKGNINISGNIGDKLASTTPHLQGMYLADGIIDTYQPDPDPLGEGSGFRLVGAGLFYARGGFDLERDLKDDCTGICNKTTPAELFIFRPDLVLNAPRELWVSKMSWLEVAP